MIRILKVNNRKAIGFRLGVNYLNIKMFNRSLNWSFYKMNSSKVKVSAVLRTKESFFYFRIPPMVGFDLDLNGKNSRWNAPAWFRIYLGFFELILWKK